jgi:hypothetical protein
MRRVADNDALTKLVFALISVVVMLVDFMTHGTEWFHSVMMGLAVIAVLLIGDLVFDIRTNQRRDSQRRARADTLERFVKLHPNLTGGVASELHTDLENALRFNEALTEMEVDHPQLAIYSYDMFWSELVKRQSAGQNLVIHTIHACSMKVWNDDPLSPVLMQRQRQFIASGGRIVRILCEGGAKPGVSAMRAAKANLEAGVIVKYYNTHGRNVAVADYDFTWDFAVCGTHDSVIWEAFKSIGSPIKKAVYLHSDKFRTWHLPTLWAQIDSLAVEITPEEVGVTGSARPQLVQPAQSDRG